MTMTANSTLSSSESSDAELLEFIKREPKSEKAQSAFELLFTRYAKILYAYVRTRGFSEEDSDDVVQEALMRMYQQIESFDPNRGSLRAWLLKITQMIMIHLWRARKPTQGEEVENIIDEHSLDFEREAEAKDLMNSLLSKLDDRSKQIVSLINQGFTTGEIAQKMNLPISAVYVELTRARRKLQQALAVQSEPEG